MPARRHAHSGVVLLALILQWLSAAVQAQVVPPPGDEVTVTGERPGPRLWRVSSDQSSLWILGTQTPLPQRMKWRSAEVERVIASADEVLGAYSVSLSLDGLPPAESEPLRSVLPRGVYKRWAAMRDRYIDSRYPTEHLAPATAALLLRSSAYRHAGLTATDDVWKTIYDLARFHRVRVRSQEYQISRVSQEKVNQRAARRAGVRFLEATLDRLESDLTNATRRANAWAEGDLKTLQDMAANDESYIESFAYSLPFLSRDEVARIIEDEDTRLAADFERALLRNRTTFAGLPMYLLLKKDGPLSILAAAGYLVEAPEEE